MNPEFWILTPDSFFEQLRRLRGGSTVYLENWLHDIIRKTLDYSPRQSLARPDVEQYQNFKLRRALHYACEGSAFYREQFQKAGLGPDGIQNREDLSRLPLTDPLQIAENPYRFLCLSRAEIARIHTFVTSGTTGPQKKIFWTQGDLDRITGFMAAGIGTVAYREDVVQILLPDGRPHSQADLLYQGVRKLGAVPVLASLSLSAREQFGLIEQWRSTVLFGYAGRVFRISKELQDTHDLRNAGIKVLFLAAEYLPDPRRREMEAMWNCRVHTHYGLTEMGLGVAVECDARNGYHFNEADLLLEIVDPQTGNPVTAGQEGELVFTTLNREAMPLIRYRTHDISRLITEPCACGAHSLLKFDSVKKRLELIVKLEGGDEVYPVFFDDRLSEIPGFIDYQLIVTRHEGKDRLDFRIETMPGCADRIPEIRQKLLSTPLIAINMAAGRMAEPLIEMVGWGALQTADRAKKLIVDRREELAPICGRG